MTDKIVQALFDTKAIRVAPAETPFWYTSGKLGPFFINTHFLARNEETASGILKLIESAIAEDRNTAPHKIFDAFCDLYKNDEIYRNCIDSIVETAKKYDFDFISGGERRDFFFSMVPAHILGKPHLTIFKDLSSVITDSNFDVIDYDFKGMTALHIAGHRKFPLSLKRRSKTFSLRSGIARTPPSSPRPSTSSIPKSWGLVRPAGWSFRWM